MSIPDEVRKHLQLEIVSLDNKLIRARHEDAKAAAHDIGRRGLTYSGLAVTLHSKVWEDYARRRVDGHSEVYLFTLHDLSVPIDEEIEVEIAAKLDQVATIRHAPPSPAGLAMNLPDGRLISEHIKEKMQSAASGALLEAKNKLRRARLKNVSTAASENPGFSNMHFHGPVGSVGHHSTGSVTVNQQWVSGAPEPDWVAVASAISEAISIGTKTAASRDDFTHLAQLASAKEEAEKKDKVRFLEVIAKAGQGVLPILADAGAHGLIAYLEQHLGWKLE